MDDLQNKLGMYMCVTWHKLHQTTLTTNLSKSKRDLIELEIHGKGFNLFSLTKCFREGWLETFHIEMRLHLGILSALATFKINNNNNIRRTRTR